MNTGAIKSRDWWILAALTVVSVRTHAQDAQQAPALSPALPAPTPAEPVPPATPDLPTASPTTTAAGLQPEVAADSSAAAGGGNDITELSADELAALGLGGAQGAEPVDTSVKLSGFLDVTYAGQKSPDNSLFRGMINRHGSFWVGSANLYVSKNITENIRTMFEVRFSYLPNGTPGLGSSSGELVNTSAADYNDAGRAQRWSGIIMQRAYLEWSLDSAAILRVGQYLTPYGIWNVDHGSPTIISVMRPFIVGAQLFPERQTGLQLFGRWPATEHNTFNYALTLSNGFGPISEYRDLDDNVAFGGRVAWMNDAFGELTIGGSWLFAKDTSAQETLSILPGTKVGYIEKISLQSDVISLAADLQWKYEGLIFQTEIITQQRTFTDVGRVGATNPALGRYIAPKDALSWGTYGLLGYRSSLFGIMPYAMLTYNKMYDLGLLSFSPAWAVIAGLNIRPLDAVVLKLEYVAIGLIGPDRPSDDLAHILQAQLAWAF